MAVKHIVIGLLLILFTTLWLFYYGQFLRSGENLFNLILDQPSSQQTEDGYDAIVEADPNVEADNNELPLHFVTALNHAYRSLKKEIREYHLEPEEHTQKTLVISRWKPGVRSGLTDLFNAHKGSFIVSEPFKTCFQSGILVCDIVGLADSILRCDYDTIPDIWPLWPVAFDFDDNLALTRTCGRGRWKSTPMCSDPRFLKPLCLLYQHQILITTHATLGLVKDIFMKNQNADELKLIYVVRDPRSILNEEMGKKQLWKGEQESIGMMAATLCKELQDDFHQYSDLKRKFPYHVMSLRFEDVSDQSESLNSIADFLEWPDLINSTFHSTPKSPESVSHRWRKSMTFDNVALIQKECEATMRLWGYRKANDEFEAFRFDPIEPLSYEEKF